MSSSHHLTILRTSSLTIRENPRERLGVGHLQILSPVVDSLSKRETTFVGLNVRLRRNLPVAVQQSRLYGCVASGCAPASRGCSYVCMLLRHSSATARVTVHHPPRGGRLNGWHAVRQMLCIASYHVISIHPTDSVWSWKSDLNR